MIQIKRFIEKVSLLDSRQGKDLVLPATDARILRDEIAQLLVDMHDLQKNQKTNEVIQIEINGGTFK